MEIKEILARVDHTLLSPTATFDDIKVICDDAVKYGTACVCIPPCYVKDAVDYVCGKVKICTVIGFPLGYMSTAAKCTEAEDAVKSGADELDMVINIGFLKAGKYTEIEDEIRALKNICGDRILKVIIETCLLTDEEKIIMCKIVSAAGADYIKTSTGFSTGGATANDIELFAKHKDRSLKIKAAGGISSLADAEEFISLGADRLGTSKIVKIIKEGSSSEGY